MDIDVSDQIQQQMVLQVQMCYLLYDRIVPYAGVGIAVVFQRGVLSACVL